MSKQKQTFQSFEEFWPHYVRQHSKKLTRQIHFASTTAAVGCVAVGLLTRRRWLLALAPVAGYGPAWLSHWLVEGNRPETLRHPLWSLRADWLMWAKMLDGSMDAEVERRMGEDVAAVTIEPAEARGGPDIEHDSEPLADPAEVLH